MAIFDIT